MSGGFIYSPPNFDSPIYNSLFYGSSNDYDARYVKININATLLSLASTDASTLNISVNGSWYSNGTQILNSSRQLQNLSYIDFQNSSQLYKTLIRANTVSGNGIEFVDSQFNTSNAPMLNFKTTNADSVIFQRWTSYLSDNNGSVASQPPPLILSFNATGNYSSGYQLKLGNSIDNTTQLANFGIYSFGGVNAYDSGLCFINCNNRYQNLILMPNTTSLVSSNYSYAGQTYKIILGDSTVAVNGLECHGKNTVFRIRIRNTQGTGIDRTSMEMLADATTFEISVGNSSHITVPLGYYIYRAGYRFVIANNGNVGIGGSTAPFCPLTCLGSSNWVIGPTGNATAYSYNMTTGAWANLGVGPITVSNCTAYFEKNIHCTGIWCSSDR